MHLIRTAAIALLALIAPPPLRGADKPNILWLTSEDHGPHLGCYGDTLATTPNVDRLAAKGMRYNRVWSCAPVCAPARSTIISGLYPPATGAEHMRSMVPFPKGKPMFPQLLRAAGYYCTNHSKEDYNLANPGLSSGHARSSPRLGPVLRHGECSGYRCRAAAQGTGRRWAHRRDDHLLLRRSR